MAIDPRPKATKQQKRLRREFLACKKLDNDLYVDLFNRQQAGKPFKRAEAKLLKVRKEMLRFVPSEDLNKEPP